MSTAVPMFIEMESKIIDSVGFSGSDIFNILIPIICIIIFVVVLSILYYIDDPGLKEIKKTRSIEVERGYQAAAASLPTELGGPASVYSPLLAATTNNCHHSVGPAGDGPAVDTNQTAAAVEEGGGRQRHNSTAEAAGKKKRGLSGEGEDQLVPPPRRRTFSDSTVDLGSVKKSSSETQVVLETFLFRGRSHNFASVPRSSGEGGGGFLSTVGVHKMRWSRGGSSRSSQPDTGTSTTGGRAERKTSAPPRKGVVSIKEEPATAHDYTDQNYVTIS